MQSAKAPNSRKVFGIRIRPSVQQQVVNHAKAVDERIGRITEQALLEYLERHVPDKLLV
jgi:hypothetical protein